MIKKRIIVLDSFKIMQLRNVELTLNFTYFLKCEITFITRLKTALKSKKILEEKNVNN